MTRLIINGKPSPEGYATNKFFEDKMILRNQNILIAITGSTGSGKSYSCLRICELWYQKQFNKSFPISNVCFSISEVMNLLNSGKLKKGEIIIIEEGGVLLNSLDFQNKVSKVFTFVLQSFRSMNIGLIINLPNLGFLNKTTRYLLHANFITIGINYHTAIIKLKPFFHQINQSSGKIYQKYLRIKSKGMWLTMKHFSYKIPSKNLINAYEKKKAKFVGDLNKNFVEELKQQELEVKRKMARNSLTDTQLNIFNMLNEGLNVKDIAEKTGTTTTNIYKTIQHIKRKGFEPVKPKKIKRCA